MKSVGVIGGGQLGQMLGLAGRDIGVSCRFLDPSSAPPAASAGEVLQYAYDDREGLQQLAESVDVVTYEFENVPVVAVDAIAERVAVYPAADALRAAQDRLDEKRLFRSLEIPTPEFHNVESRDALSAAASQVGFPFVLKTRRLGYDGKGQMVVRDETQLDDAWQALGTVPLIAEQWIDFDREISVIGTRRGNGDIVTYPLSQNVHRQGILHATIAPAEGAELARLGESYHSRLLQRLEYVGTLALEMFIVGDRLLANEFAPRVHNSGHWTIEGAATSQFENHLRAILDLPLGDTTARGHAAMVNLLGEMPNAPEELSAMGCFIHDYGKSPRPGRKLGHVTTVVADAEERNRRVAAIERLLTRR